MNDTPSDADARAAAWAEEWTQRWFNGGVRAYYNGFARNKAPQGTSAQKCFTRKNWLIGWDCAAAYDAGTKAQARDACPYLTLRLKKNWLSGWRETHGLQAVRKDPTPRLIHAAPDDVSI